MKTLSAILLLLAPLAAYAQERALVDAVTGEVREFKTPAPPPTNPAKWLPVLRLEPPPFDDATQRLERSISVGEDLVTVGWTVVDLEPQEILDRQVEQAANAERTAKRQAVVQAVSVLRQWADDADGTTVTTGNVVAVTQTMVNRLGTFFDRFADLIEGTGIGSEE